MENGSNSFFHTYGRSTPFLHPKCFITRKPRRSRDLHPQSRLTLTCLRIHCGRSKLHDILHASVLRWDFPSSAQVGCRCLNGLLSGLLSLTFLLSSPIAVGAVTATQDKNDSLTIKFKASKNPSIREAQEALVQTWGYASTQYLDPTFNGINWSQQLQVHHLFGQ